MPRRRSRAANPLTFWMNVMSSGIATAVTLSVRLPQLAAGTMSAAESRRMVDEKIAATGGGVIQGAMAATRIGTKRSRKPAPHLAVHEMMEIADAASGPARRRVQANAKRLSRARPR